MVLGVQPVRHAGVSGVSRELGEGHGDGVPHPDIFKGVLTDRAHALSVHQHIFDLVTLVGGDGEGLAAALGHPHDSFGTDAAALPGGGLDAVTGDRVRILGERGCNGMVLFHSRKGVAAYRAHTDAVHQHVLDVVASVGGDGDVLILTGSHGEFTTGRNTAVFPGGGGDGVSIDRTVYQYEGRERASIKFYIFRSLHRNKLGCYEIGWILSERVL